jgi:pimeloyl-ACP methyl ester carboxylesterase
MVLGFRALPRGGHNLPFAIVACAFVAGAVFAISASAAWAYEDVPHASLVSAKPGAVFQMSPFEDGVPAGYKGYRIIYRSTGLEDEPIAVTGAVFFPAANEAGAARPIVAWAHGTTGVMTPCAPTLKPGLVETIQGIDLFASKGYVVVASDYPGLGSPGDHPYLIGESAAHAVLDSVRAVRNIEEARAGDRFIVWGHSQGGHAALFTGMQAHAYAPELKLAGVAAAAPVSRPFDVLSLDTDPFSGRLFSALLYSAWSRLFDFPLSKYVNEDKVATFAELGANCLQTAEDLAKIEADEKALETDFFKSDPLKDPFIVGVMAENTAGALPKGMPVFLAQGTTDDTVHPSITQAYAKEVCAGGSKLKLHIMDGVGHIMAAHDSAALAAEWMDALFNGREPPNEC